MAILGATGLVGQRLVERLRGHDWFDVAVVAASERSVGRRYGEAVSWALPGAPSASVADLVVAPCEAGAVASCDLALSALDRAPAVEVEPAIVAAGVPVISNSSAYRMDPGVPLVVPEVNPDHVEIFRESGRVPHVANPNCSVAGLAVALAPIHAAFGVRRAVVVTLQALSGAGVSGPRALDLVDNVVPHIAGEEDKLETELRKILGRRDAAAFVETDVRVSAHCHRVAVSDGHLEAVSLETERPADAAAVARVLREFEPPALVRELPSSPERAVVVRDEDDRPQPRLDRDAGDGMTVVVGRVRPCPVLGVKLELLSHNAVRGAAGGTLLVAELLARRGLVGAR